MEWPQLIKELVSIAAGLAVIVGVVWGLRLANQVIQTKQATVDLLKEERDRYKALAMPAVAAEHKAAIEFAERIAAEKQDLEQSINQMKGEIDKGQEETEQEQLLGVSLGCSEAAAGLELLIGDYLASPRLATGPFDFIAAIKSLRENLLEQAREAIVGRRPAYPNLHRRDAQIMATS
jgi:hypothetical protein